MITNCEGLKEQGRSIKQFLPLNEETIIRERLYQVRTI